MPHLSKTELRSRVTQALNERGWDVLYLPSPAPQAYHLRIYQAGSGAGTTHTVLLYIHNTTPGGNHRPLDEWRIQPTSGGGGFLHLPATTTLILGWQEAKQVFTGYDYKKHRGGIGTSSSFQIKENKLDEAATQGMSAYAKANHEAVICFQQKFLVDYVANLDDLHKLGESESAIKALSEAATGRIALTDALVTSLPVARQTRVRTTVEKIRASDFATRVLAAYGNCCAFSGMQLTLVDAAHIVPVALPDSTDDTANGIALSALYHRAYDRGLVTFGADYKIKVNAARIQSLTESNLGAEAATFTANLRQRIIVPEALTDRPAPNFIHKANKLRGW